MKCFGDFNDNDRTCELCKRIDYIYYKQCKSQKEIDLEKSKFIIRIQSKCGYYDITFDKDDYIGHYVCKKKFPYKECVPKEKCIGDKK